MLNLFQETLTKIDIYGFMTGFSDSKESQFKTRFGGLLTVITFIIGLILFWKICLPVFWNYNPSVFSQSARNDYYSFFELSNENFPIAFRFEDESRSKVNVTKKLYTYAEAIELRKNNITGNMERFNHTFINIKDCNTSIWKIPEVKGGGDFKCLDFGKKNEFRLGGGLYSEKSIFFKITVFFCEFDGKNFTNCSDYRTINDFLSSQKKIYFSIWFPDISINPKNTRQPLKVSFENSLNTLSPLMMKTDRYYYHHTKLEQDSGIVMENINKFNGFSFNRKETEYQLRTIEDILDAKKIKTLSTSVFSISNQEDNIIIRYKKLQTQLSDMNSLLKLVTLVFLLLNTFVGEKVMIIKIADQIFNLEFSKKDQDFYNFVTQNNNKDIKLIEKPENQNSDFLSRIKNQNKKADKNLDLIELTKIPKLHDKKKSNNNYLKHYLSENIIVNDSESLKTKNNEKSKKSFSKNTCFNKEEQSENFVNKNSLNISRISGENLTFIEMKKNIQEFGKDSNCSYDKNKNKNIKSNLEINFVPDCIEMPKESNFSFSLFDKSITDSSVRKGIKFETEEFLKIKNFEKASGITFNNHLNDNDLNRKEDIRDDNINSSNGKYIITNFKKIFDLKSKFYIVCPFKPANKHVEANYKIFQHIKEGILEKLDISFYVKSMYWHKKHLLEDKNKDHSDKDFIIDLDNFKI